MPPHIRDLQTHDICFILGAKDGDHQYMFDYIDQAAERGDTTEFSLQEEDDADIFHCFRFINQAPLNTTNKDLQVNFLEYWQANQKGEVIRRFSWVTDLEITRENARDIMRTGRCRWRIENETFNTLKNQGYNLGHNYGLGKKHLSGVFTILMMLAFLIDQACHELLALPGGVEEGRGQEIPLGADPGHIPSVQRGLDGVHIPGHSLWL
jgi:hypothetical protein